MPNAKVFVAGEWIAFVVGKDGVSKIFSNEAGNLVVLGDTITEFANVPFVLERDYKKNVEA